MNACLVTSYQNPDLDGAACAFAYTELLQTQGRDATPTILGTAHLEARHVAERFGITLPTELDPRDFREIILVDTSMLADLDDRLMIDRVIEIIDHRKINDGTKFPNAKLQIELVGSAATLVAERFIQANQKPSSHAAHLLYGAIASNTVNFKANVTTDRDKQAAAWLKTLYPIPDDLIAVMFAAKSQLDGDTLQETIVNDFSSREINGKRIGIGQLEMVGAKKLIETRYQDLVQTLASLQKIHPEVAYSFISLIDVVDGYNVFLVLEPEIQKALHGFLGVTFNEQGIAYRDGILMRKELGPLWKEWAEK